MSRVLTRVSRIMDIMFELFLSFWISSSAIRTEKKTETVVRFDFINNRTRFDRRFLTQLWCRTKIFIAVICLFSHRLDTTSLILYLVSFVGFQLPWSCFVHIRKSIPSCDFYHRVRSKGSTDSVVMFSYINWGSYFSVT